MLWFPFSLFFLVKKTYCIVFPYVCNSGLGVFYVLVWLYPSKIQPAMILVEKKT